MGAPGAFTPAPSDPPVHTPKLLSVLQRLDSLVDWERRERGGAAPGSMRLTRTSTSPALTLLSRLGNPQKTLSTIHITGSKGKGSVACMLTAALLRAPFLQTVVGTYGSPHVERINERVRINARPVPDDDLADALKKTLDAREAPPIAADSTWFDVMTAAAFVAFQRVRARWAVVEVGMGGRLDSTNVIAAPVAVITNIHLEHANIIGPTLLDIAYEKAGIIAPGAHVICGMEPTHDLARVFEDEGRSHPSPALVQFCPPRSASIFEHNLELARAAMSAVAQREGVRDMSGEDLLPRHVAQEAMRGMPARQEIFRVALDKERGDVAVKVLLDGAHVPESVALVLKEAMFERGPIVVLGIGKEKDIRGICSSVHAAGPHCILATTAGSQSPYLPAKDLAVALKQAGNAEVVQSDDAEEALNRAVQLAHATERDVVVVGSLHLAGRLRAMLRKRQHLHSKWAHMSRRQKAAS